MKNKYILLLICFILSNCTSKKNSIEPSSSTPENWEIIKHYNVAPKFYDNAQLVVIDQKIFLSAHSSEFGNRSSNLFFDNANGIQNYEKANEHFIALKSFGGTVYGILNYVVPSLSGQVQTYKHSYYLYRWGVNAFENIAKLDHVDQNGLRETMLQNIQLWEQQNQLFLIAQQSNGESLQWTVSSTGFSNKKTIGNIGVSSVIIANEEQISFTNVGQTQTQTEVIHTINSANYNGQNLNIGTTHTFRKSNDGYFDNTSIFYAAFQNHLFGYVPKQVKNLSLNTTLTSLTDENVFSSGKNRIANGKIYSTLTDNKGNCSEILIFNGKEAQKKQFNLPNKIDKCAIILDAYQEKDKLYLAVLSNRQLYVIKEK